MEHMSEFFTQTNELKENHTGCLTFAQPADMSSLQKTVLCGGAIKSKTFACYCCNIHKDDLAKPNTSPCVDCVRLCKTSPCFHCEMSDENLIERLRRERERDETLRVFPHLPSSPGVISTVW